MNIVEPEFEVCELFSRPRVCPVAQDIGLNAGYSLDPCVDGRHHAATAGPEKRTNSKGSVVDAETPETEAAGSFCTTLEAFYRE